MRLTQFDRETAIPAGILAAGFGLMQIHAAGYWMDQTGSAAGAAWPVVIEAAGLYMCARPVATGAGWHLLLGSIKKAGIRTAGAVGIGVVLASGILQVGGDSLWSAVETVEARHQRAERIDTLEAGIDANRASIQHLESKSSGDNYLVAERSLSDLRSEVNRQQDQLQDLEAAQAAAPGLVEILQGSVASILAALALVVVAISNVAQAATVLPRRRDTERDTDATDDTVSHDTGVAEGGERGSRDTACDMPRDTHATDATPCDTPATADVTPAEPQADNAAEPAPAVPRAEEQDQAAAIDGPLAGGEDDTATEGDVASVTPEAVSRDTASRDTAQAADPEFMARRVSQILRAERDAGATRAQLAERYGIRGEEVSRVLNPHGKRKPAQRTIQALAEQILPAQSAQA